MTVRRTSSAGSRSKARVRDRHIDPDFGHAVANAFPVPNKRRRQTPEDKVTHLGAHNPFDWIELA
jgi:hypothetical protein